MTKVAAVEEVVEEGDRRTRAAAGTAVVPSDESLPEESSSALYPTLIRCSQSCASRRASLYTRTYAEESRAGKAPLVVARRRGLRTAGHGGGVREDPLSPGAGHDVAGSAGRRIAFESHARARLSDRLWSPSVGS